jgi:hypothetical protein
MLQEVFRDHSMSVRRWPDDHGPALARTGAAGLALEIAALQGTNSQALRVETKIFRIVLTKGGFATRNFLTLFARTELGSREVHAVWDCTWTLDKTGDAPRFVSILLQEYEETDVTAANGTLLSDCTLSLLGENSGLHEQLGFGLDYWNNRILNVDTSGMQGLAIGDVNGDGLEDFYVCQSAPLPNRLFVQNPDGTATDRSSEAGVDWQEPTHGALLIDMDNDGDQDLLVGTTASLLLMENDGTGRFRMRSQFPEARNAYTLAAADFDLDGDLDVFACIYLAKVRRQQILAVPVPFHDARNGGRNVLLRNDGAWRMTDVTRETGLEPEATRRSFAASWEDFDQDGDPDFYVSNDYGRNNLFRNDNGKFVDVAAAAGVEDQSFGMSAAWGDYNRDGWMDVYVANMFSAAGNRIVFQEQFRRNEDAKVREKFQYMARGNSLFENSGNGTFRDVSAASATMVGLWAWGSTFADLNNDGWEDLLVANGHLTRRNTKDL